MSTALIKATDSFKNRLQHDPKLLPPGSNIPSYFLAFQTWRDTSTVAAHKQCLDFANTEKSLVSVILDKEALAFWGWAYTVSQTCAEMFKELKEHKKVSMATVSKRSIFDAEGVRYIGICRNKGFGFTLLDMNAEARDYMPEETEVGENAILSDVESVSRMYTFSQFERDLFLNIPEPFAWPALISIAFASSKDGERPLYSVSQAGAAAKNNNPIIDFLRGLVPRMN